MHAVCRCAELCQCVSGNPAQSLTLSTLASLFPAPRRPKIISKDGNLVFESGRNRNISFRLNGNSRLLVNGEYDVLNLLMPINGNKKRPGSGAKDEWTGPEDIVDIRQLADQLAEFKESSSGADVALRQLQNR